MKTFLIGFLAGALGATATIGLFWQYIMPKLLGRMVASSVFGILSQLTVAAGQKNAAEQAAKFQSTDPVHLGQGEFFRVPSQERPA